MITEHDKEYEKIVIYSYPNNLGNTWLIYYLFFLILINFAKSSLIKLSCELFIP